MGVDVFFVISGFLITGHLMREVDRTGRIRLLVFWARRARRLLPASLLVLLVTAVATVLLVPDTFWRQYLTEIGASTLYVENWLLAANAVNYLAAENLASPVQHFWSLSAEEQFYLLWPVLILLTVVVAARRSPARARAAVAVVLGAVTVASFWIGVVWTVAVPATAYFVTPTRVWEFAAGGVLAVLGVGCSPGSRLAPLLSWAGLAGIAVAAIGFTGASPFPGWIALLPVAGAIAVIAAGNPLQRWSPTRPGSLRPVQVLGDISYAVYLWHWPMIVLLPGVLGRPLAVADKLGVLAATVVLAYATKVLVEDPFRFSSPLVSARPRWTFLAIVASAAALLALCWAAVAVVDERIEDASARVTAATAGSCFGAAALDPDADCPEPFAFDGSMTPAFAKTDTNLVADSGGGWQCEVPRGASDIRTCVIGETSQPERTFAMLGDSHAMHLMEAMRAITAEREWQVLTYFKSGCSGTGASDVLRADRPDDQVACAEWGAAAIAEIAANPAIDTVVFANVSSAYLQSDGAEPIGPERYLGAWEPLIDAGKGVIVVADIPHVSGGDVPACLAAAGALDDACSTPRAAALPPDAAVDAARRGSDAIRLLSLTDHFCQDETCHARIGGVIVYSDSAHLTNTYARTLAPYIERALVTP